jgi:hypothetical protein
MLERVRPTSPPTRATIFRSEQAKVFDRGRVRVDEFDAAVLYETLALRVDQALDTRGELIHAGFDVEAYFNRKIRSLRRVMGELERTIIEKGWDLAGEVVDQYKSEDDA